MKTNKLSILIFLITACYDVYGSSLLGQKIYGCLELGTPTTDGCNENAFIQDTITISDFDHGFKNIEADWNENYLGKENPIFMADFIGNTLELRVISNVSGYDENPVYGTGFWFFELLGSKLRVTNVVSWNGGDYSVGSVSFTRNTISIETSTMPLYGNGLNWHFQIETQTVPLPAAFWLFAAGVVGLISVNRLAYKTS